MSLSRSHRNSVAQDWLRSNIRYLGNDRFHSETSDACLFFI